MSDYFWVTSAYDLTPFDLERVEFLKGPQGTLYGAASLGGAMRYITKSPNLTRHEGALHLTTTSVTDGGTNFLAQGMFNAVVAEGKFAIRGVVARQDTDGFVDNIPLDKENWNPFEQTNGRLLATWQPSEKFRLDATFIIQDTDREGAGSVMDRNDPDFDRPQQTTFEQWDATFEQKTGNLTLTIDLGFADLMSSTSYVTKALQQDIDYGPLLAWDLVTTNEFVLMSIGLPVNIGDLSSQVTAAPLYGTQDTDSWFQEFRLVSKDTGTFDWIVGAYYADVNNDFTTIQFLDGMEDAVNGIVPGFGTLLYADDQSLLFIGGNEATEYALYGELGIDLSEKWKLTAGGRYFDYESEDPLFFRTFGADTEVDPIPNETSDFMPKVSLAYRPSGDFLWYSLVSRGYRVGGANTTAALAPPGTDVPLTFDTDRLWNYETGVKKTWADGRVITDLTLFYLDWQDIQLQGSFAEPTSPSGLISAVLNTGKAHSLGIEAYFYAQLTSGLSFTTSLTWVEAELDEDSTPIQNPETLDVIVVPAGSRMPATPEMNIASTLQYYFNSPKLGFPFIALSHIHKGDMIDGFSTQQLVPSWDLLNLRIGATFAKDFQVSLGINNLLDDRQRMTRSGPVRGTFVPETVPLQWYITTPRSISLTLQKNF